MTKKKDKTSVVSTVCYINITKLRMSYVYASYFNISKAVFFVNVYFEYVHNLNGIEDPN